LAAISGTISSKILETGENEKKKRQRELILRRIKSVRLLLGGVVRKGKREKKKVAADHTQKNAILGTAL